MCLLPLNRALNSGSAGKLYVCFLTATEKLRLFICSHTLWRAVLVWAQLDCSAGLFMPQASAGMAGAARTPLCMIHSRAGCRVLLFTVVPRGRVSCKPLDAGRGLERVTHGYFCFNLLARASLGSNPRSSTGIDSARLLCNLKNLAAHVMAS